MSGLAIEEVSAICARLAQALAHAPPASPAGDGWVLRGAAPQLLTGGYFPVVTFERGASTLGFIVLPTDPHARVYKRSARLDIVYFSEDALDDRQQKIYDENRAMIDRFVAWVIAWDQLGEPLS